MCDQEYKAGVVYLDNAATTRMAEEAEAAMPVSYTHLDVYKRQGYV